MERRMIILYAVLAALIGAAFWVAVILWVAK